MIYWGPRRDDGPPCPECGSVKTRIVMPTSPEVLTHRCIACGFEWTAPHQAAPIPLRRPRS